MTMRHCGPRRSREALAPGGDLVFDSPASQREGCQWEGCQWEGCQWEGCQWEGCQWEV